MCENAHIQFQISIVWLTFDNVQKVKVISDYMWLDLYVPEDRDNAGAPRVARPLRAAAHPSAAPPDYEF